MLFTSRRQKIWFVLLAITVSLQLSGCNEGAGRKMSLFFSGNDVNIADRVELTADGIEIGLDPPIEVKNTVQYIKLAVPSAGQWGSGSKPGMLVMPDGNSIELTVDLESASGQRFGLRSVSFGKELMFSHIDEHSSQSSDLPRGEQFVRLYLAASQPLVIDKVSWSDVTNK